MWLYFIFHRPYIQESTRFLSSSQSPGLGQVKIGGFKEGETKAGDAFNIEDTKSGDALNLGNTKFEEELYKGDTKDGEALNK